MADAFAARGGRAATALVLLVCLVAFAGPAGWVIADLCDSHEDSSGSLACANPVHARRAGVPTLDHADPLEGARDASQPLSHPASPRTLRAPPGS